MPEKVPAINHFNLDGVEDISATVTIDGEIYQVRSLADLSFTKMNELRRLYNEVQEDQEILTRQEGWDSVKKQILILIPGLSEQVFEDKFTVQKVNEFLRWHGDLSRTIVDEKNGGGASE